MQLLDADLDLADRVDPSRRDAATERSMVDTAILEPGTLRVDTLANDVAYLVLSGTIARRAHVGAASSLEFLAVGQVLRPGSDAWDSIVTETSLEVITPVWLAVLDSRFWLNMAAFPEVTVALFDRAVDRSHQLGARLALSGTPDLLSRLRLLFRHLADSHGRVTANGVVIELKLSHRTIAHLVSAHRSSVSTALKRLESAGEVLREKGHYLISHAPPLPPNQPPS